MSDGRVLIGQLLCTDRDQNIILSGCSEFVRLERGAWCLLGILRRCASFPPRFHPFSPIRIFPPIIHHHADCDPTDESGLEESRQLGMVMVPGNHIERLELHIGEPSTEQAA